MIRSQQQPGSGGALSPELQARVDAAKAAGINIDFGGGSSGPDPNDPSIYFGETRVQTADGDVLRAKGGRNKYGGVTTKPLTQANAAFYEMSQDELIEFQRRLVGAGVLDPDKLRLGDYDDDTYSAWSAINERTAKFNSVGKKVTPSDVLGMIERAYDPRQEEPDKAQARRNLIASFGTDLHVYRRSDPASIRQTAEAAFREAIGRKPKKDELEKFTARFLGAERSNQAAGFAKQDDLTAASRSRALAAVDAAGTGEGGPVASAATEDGMSESEVLMNRLQRMIADAPGKIGLGKTTRSYEEQVRLWNNYKSGKGPLAAKPGTSKHGDGRANDLKYENEATRQWALANASKYGLAFPIYDPKKPRSKDESWHVEVMVGPGLGRGSAASAPAGPAAAPPISTSITDQAQDVGAQAIEFARTSNPVETAAYDIGGQFSNMLSILSKGVI